MPRALLSVYDKTGIVELAGQLDSLGYELVSTGGTHAALTGAGLPVRSVGEVTGFPEILDGRVKTLHPAIHGGLLGRVELPDHRETMASHGIVPIDLLACNLYPFEATVATPDISFDDAVEQIDIGGPAMIRAAAKNQRNVVVLTDPRDYQRAFDRLATGSADVAWRRSLSAAAFRHVSYYDSLVARYLDGDTSPFPDELTVSARATELDLRYGENPHQSARAYRTPTVGRVDFSVLDAEKLGGKALSYNNVLDTDAAAAVVRSFVGPACVVVKHIIPCGVAIGSDAATATARAIASDPVSAFGGIVAVNRPVDEATADVLLKTFFEVVLAPAFTEAAIERLRAKTQLRLLAHPMVGTVSSGGGMSIRTIAGGLLAQRADARSTTPDGWTVVTTARPTAADIDDLGFAWNVVSHAKSNAIALAVDGQLVGLGCGQPNRLDAVRHAVERAGDRAGGAVLASDAFFPFADGVEAAVRAGVRAIVQPGGSVRDAEVVAAANAADIAMLFTGERHFRH